ncbi:hypothetical protein DPEC_G00195010 [Dallia pectoralis]|uniref:Uncharacterized protein n=1 Tax=Dallia pectoralis TaxID=75939 RepID=A0ACC2G7A1_DALPE|nr:hypothetical protein DPEC_G00195010 [Dallia pectoralis]
MFALFPPFSAGSGNIDPAIRDLSRHRHDYATAACCGTLENANRTGSGCLVRRRPGARSLRRTLGQFPEGPEALDHSVSSRFLLSAEHRVASICLFLAHLLSWSLETRAVSIGSGTSDRTQQGTSPLRD